MWELNSLSQECKLNFLQNQKSQILKVEADALELNLNCWCTSRDTLEIITAFAFGNYWEIYSDSTNFVMRFGERQQLRISNQTDYQRRFRQPSEKCNFDYCRRQLASQNMIRWKNDYLVNILTSLGLNTPSFQWL
ncbi:Hypothetical_protein [Hexamita inflata]|uniref:Hypothetical_protein n=1 Tax=Hexamita inflata TaxID=28002 RepID=A0ABP1HWV7_9EUKA